MQYFSDLYDVKKLLLSPNVCSLVSFLSLAAYSEGRPPGSDREEKVYLIVVLFKLNDVPRTPADSFSYPGVKK